LQTAIRYERYFGKDGQWFPHMGINMVPYAAPYLSFTYSWSRASRYPDFNSLFWKSDTRARGNPDLLPEKKRGWQTGLNFETNHIMLPSAGILYFDEEIEDLIFWHRSVQGIWEPRNEARVHSQGLDLNIKQYIIPEKVEMQMTYALLETINLSPEPNYYQKDIVFTPRHTVNAALWLSHHPFDCLFNYRYVSTREIVRSNTGVPLDPYHILDLSLAYNVTFHQFLLEIDLALKNITGTSYELIRGYPMPGRAIQIGSKIYFDSPR
jgi:outer membrane cobalamin receptor